MNQQVILGIDPGSKLTGFGVLSSHPNKSRSFWVKDAGVIRPTTQKSHSDRLGEIHEAVYNLIAECKPEVCVIEKGFTGINHHSALRLGETRGAIISAARRLEVKIVETAPTTVKKNVTGQGHASKEAISLSLKALLGFDRGGLPYDVTDAVAIALSYGMSSAFFN